MNFLDALVMPPRAEHILIARYSIIVLSLLFIVYMSILFGSTFFALGFTIRGKSEDIPLFRRFSADISEMFLSKKGVSIILGVLPLLVLAINFSQLLYNRNVQISGYFSVVLTSVIAALVFVHLFRNSFQTRDEAPARHYLLGLIALGLLLFAIYTFVSTVALSLYPEEWMFVSEYLLFPFEWSIIARFLNFIIAALALTGVAILFFFFNWMGGLQGLDAEYKNYIRKFGGGVALGCTILQTLFLLWFLLVIPEFAKSFAVYFIGAFGALLLLVICIHLYYWLVDANKNYGTRLFVMFIVFFLLVSVDENLARDNSLQYQIYALEKLDMEIQSEIEAEREAKAGAEKEATVELGEEIYNQKCTACHQFDQRVVGPPYNSVLPKYEEDLEALKEFILNPVKVNPDYPAMPNQGLKPHEAEAAAKYLIQRYNELKQ